MFDLLSIVGKLRAGLGALGLRPAAPAGVEESVEAFVRRNLGDEVFERLIEPFCSGVYAGDPSKLSMKAAFGKVWRLEATGGSIVGGSIKAIQAAQAGPKTPYPADLPKPKGQTVASFKRGLITLPNALAKQLGDRVKVSWTLTGVTKVPTGYSLAYSTPDGPTTVAARCVVFTLPAHAAAPLLPLPPLASLYYPPVGAVTLSYPESALHSAPLIGFGQLHPRSQGITTLGTIYSSSLFPNRAPPGFVTILNYIGGAKNTGIATQPQADIVAQVDKDLRVMLLKPDAPPPRVLGVRVWQQAIPQFNVGHGDVMATAKAELAAKGWSGAFLGGNYAIGVALGRCVEGSAEQADEVAAFVATAPALA